MDEEFLSSQDELKPPQHERWTPLGAAASPDPVIFSEPRSLNADHDRMQLLEQEKEELQQSLFSLTSRFAQIQFRLHQITEADPEDKAKLLQELDDLANRGCIDNTVVFEVKQSDHENQEDRQEENRNIEKHEEIIQELKHQLNDLETYAFKHGSGGVPQSVVLEKQRVVLEQLMSKLNLKVDTEELAQASVDDLKTRVDNAVAEIVNPARIKEKLVDHLQTQIQDLERFVQFLQLEVESEGSLPKSSGSVPTSSLGNEGTKKERLVLLRRALNILQIFAVSQLGCGTRAMQAETMQDPEPTKTEPLLNNLKQAVNRVKSCKMKFDSATYNSDTGDVNQQELFYEEYETSEKEAVLAVDSELTQIVRKELCPAIAELLGHGLVVDATASNTVSLVTPISCLLPRKFNGSLAGKPLHPWELFMEYYELKHGADLARAPSRMLTRSFDLEPLVSSGGDHRISIKHSLLEAINIVIHDHNPLKRSYEVMFKALICMGLNSGRLSLWIRLVMKTSSLISNHYTDNSYVAKTGFEGALTILSRLDKISFNLPVDLAVRPFKNIRDAF